MRKTLHDEKEKVKVSRGKQYGGNPCPIGSALHNKYSKELADLEAKMARAKDSMTTGERVDTAAQEIIADAAVNKDVLVGQLEANQGKTMEILTGIEGLLKKAIHDCMKKAPSDINEKIPPSKPDDLDLMAKVLNMFDVRGMNAILKEFKVKECTRSRKEDKAARIVKAIPRDRLLPKLFKPVDGRKREPMLKSCGNIPDSLVPARRGLRRLNCKTHPNSLFFPAGETDIEGGLRDQSTTGSQLSAAASGLSPVAGSATKRRKKETTAAKGDDTTPSRKRKYHVNARKDDEPTPSKERKKDANAPKRPAGGAYGCYLEENRQRFMQQCKGQSATAVSKMAGEAWKALTAKDRKPFEDMYASKKKAYDKAKEAYKKSGGGSPAGDHAEGDGV